MAGVMPEGWAVPALDSFNQAFFTGETLTLQECASCHTVQHPPEEVCHRCLGMEFTARPTSGRGTIYSYIVVHHPVAPTLRDVVPYAIVLVSMDDVPEARVIGNVLNQRPDGIAIGQKVRVVFEERTNPDTGETVRLPQWEVVDS